MLQSEIRSTFSLLFEQAVIYSWWVVFFLILCYLFFERGQEQRDRAFKELSIQLNELKLEKEHALDLQKDLQLQINSQSDPEWIELTLRKGLGVVPEGQKKIYFK